MERSILPPTSRRHIGALLAVSLVLSLAGGAAAADAAVKADIADTLTVIQRPLINIPELVVAGSSFTINCDAEPATTGWTASLLLGAGSTPLTVTGSSYDASTLWWSVTAEVPAAVVPTLYDLQVTAAGGIDDVTRHSVRVLPSYKNDWYFVHVTDSHLPTHYFWDGWDMADSTEADDMREVIEDLNLINPEFVLHTGDLINEGELEDYEDRRVYSRTMYLLTELTVPIYIVAGNHDVGGWSDTPPSDGTARRDWWRFFGWKRLDSPPAGAPWRTQNYSFDYGDVHFVGMESYVNYDHWRDWYYDYYSFPSAQLDWLDDDLAAAAGSISQILFYHNDFSDQLTLNQLGVEGALYGHIHRDDGNESSTPFNLATDNVCDGARAYRLMRVSGGVVTPTETIYAGATGSNLRVSYLPAADGTNDLVTATVTNSTGERFEFGCVPFVMPAGLGEYSATGGTIDRIEEEGGTATVYVNVDIPASGSKAVRVTFDSTAAAPGVPIGCRLGQNHPNPFNPSTTISFVLDRARDVTVSVYSLSGDRVATIFTGGASAGGNAFVWDGRDESGRVLASGTYVYRLTGEGLDMARRMTLLK